MAGYTLSGCSVTLAVGDAKSCTVTANDNAVSAFSLPPPVIHKSVNLLPSSGKVLVKTPGRKNFVLSVDGQQVPLGTIVDARKGRVTLIAAADSSGGTATGRVLRRHLQARADQGEEPITVLTPRGEAHGLQGQGQGVDRQEEGQEAAPVGRRQGAVPDEGQAQRGDGRGTKWMVEDRCTSTLTKVARGRVKVADFGKHKTVLVKAGKKYVARAR